MNRSIPTSIIAVLADYLPRLGTHASLDNLFMHADAPGEPPEGSKTVKVQAWIRRINKEAADPLHSLGRIIEPYIEYNETLRAPMPPGFGDLPDPKAEIKSKLIDSLSRSGLRYRSGIVTEASTAGPVRSLEELIRKKDAPSLDYEFGRALSSLEADPKEAVSAACSILESTFKVYIEDENLTKPAKQDLKSVWNVVRSDLGIDASQVEDGDLQKIVSGLCSIFDGVGALRTHASSAHGHGRKTYKIKPRHARLAIHSAHTIVHFVLETWDERIQARVD